VLGVGVHYRTRGLVILGLELLQSWEWKLSVGKSHKFNIICSFKKLKIKGLASRLLLKSFQFQRNATKEIVDAVINTKIAYLKKEIIRNLAEKLRVRIKFQRSLRVDQRIK